MTSYIKYLLTISLLIACKELKQDFQNPELWEDATISSKIVTELKESKILSEKDMHAVLEIDHKKSDFEGEVRVVELENGLKGVFKACATKKEEDMKDAYAEVAAYQASIKLGFPYVPPTVIREIAKKKGSLQLFVKTTIDPSSEDNFQKAWEELNEEEKTNLKVFYFVFGQWDTGPHNSLIWRQDRKIHLIAIDNSGIGNQQYVKYGQLPFVRTIYNDALETDDWHKDFPFEEAQIIEDPTLENLRKVFGKRLPDSFYSSFKGYAHPFRYVIYKNSIWRQFHYNDTQERFINVGVLNDFSDKTKEKLRLLNLSVLHEIFTVEGKVRFSDEHLRAILERRDQILAYK